MLPCEKAEGEHDKDNEEPGLGTPQQPALGDDRQTADGVHSDHQSPVTVVAGGTAHQPVTFGPEDFALQLGDLVGVGAFEQPQHAVHGIQTPVSVVEVERMLMCPTVAEFPQFTDQAAFEWSQAVSVQLRPLIPQYGQQ